MKISFHEEVTAYYAPPRAPVQGHSPRLLFCAHCVRRAPGIFAAPWDLPHPIRRFRFSRVGAVLRRGFVHGALPFAAPFSLLRLPLPPRIFLSSPIKAGQGNFLPARKKSIFKLRNPA
ncbi:MAG: hypothetical protein PUD68_10585, partial [Clostridiales bacterium]|nr:hypothetical protein [Clostridiales bacterium]